MYRGQTIGVVVPAYNEEAHVGNVLATIPQFADRIYAVDDRSTDTTWEIIRSLAAAEFAIRDGITDQPDRLTPHPGPEAPATVPGATATPRGSIADGGTINTQRIVPIRHATNQGAGAALRTGYDRAHADEMDIVVSMDADGQMDPDQLPKLLDPIVDGEADYAKGNRLRKRDDRSRMPSFRLFGNSLLTWLTKMSSGYWGIEDPQNGYTAISHRALSAIGIDSIPDDHDYTNHLLVRLNESEMRIADVCMPAVYEDEESTIRYRTFVPRTSMTLLRGFSRRLRSRYVREGVHPVPVLYGIGILGILVSLGYGLLVMAPGIGEGLSTVVIGLVAAVLAIVGGAFLDARANAELEVAL